MIVMSVADIADVVGGQVHGEGLTPVTAPVTLDSREVRARRTVRGPRR